MILTMSLHQLVKLSACEVIVTVPTLLSLIVQTRKPEENGSRSCPGVHLKVNGQDGEDNAAVGGGVGVHGVMLGAKVKSIGPPGAVSIAIVMGLIVGVVGGMGKL